MVEQNEQPAQSAAGRPRLGGFELGVRDSTFTQQGVVVAVHATGLPATRYASHTATCYCRPLPPDAIASMQTSPWLKQAQTIRHDRIIPVIEAGVAGETAYFVEPDGTGERLSQRIRNKVETTPAQAGRMLADIFEGVAAAWQAGLDLVVAPDTVKILADGRAQMSLALSMCLNPRPGAGTDTAAQFQLALLAAMLFSGQADQNALGIDQLNGPDPMLAMTGFRERMGNLAEHVALVLVKALNPVPAQRYPTTQAFIAAFGEALQATADELAFSAIEAKNRENSGMATIYAQLIKRYDENHPEVVGPGGRLSGALQAGLTTTTAATSVAVPPQIQAQVSTSLETAGLIPAPTDAGTESPLSPEVVAMLTGMTYEPSKPRTNPWFTFAAGTVVIIAVFLFLAFLVMTNS